MAVSTFKPGILALPGLAALEWRWAWTGLCFAAPLLGTIYDIIGKKVGVPSGGAAWSPGIDGFAMSLDGNDDKIEFVDSPGHRAPSTALTVFVRWKANGVGDNTGALFTKHHTDYQSYEIHQISTYQRIGAQVRTTSGTASVNDTSMASLPTTRFVNCFLRWTSGDYASLDVLENDGRVYSTKDSPSTLGGTIVYGSFPMAIGDSKPSANFGGLCSIACVWSRSLANREIISLAQNPFAPFCPRWMPYSAAAPPAGTILRHMMMYHGG